MHFLCLHGMGTSGEIFKLQTSAIRHRLGSMHTYDFLDGAHTTTPAPGIEQLMSSSSSSSTTEYLAWLSPDPAESVASAKQALDDLAEYIENEGPFDGVIAFSQGAGLVASLMVRQRQRNVTESLLRPIFPCGVFFSGAVPGDAMLLEQEGKEIRFMSREVDGVVIDVPTAHIWGLKDDIYPVYGPVLADLCNDQNKEVVKWDGGHEVPGLSGGRGVKEAVEAIQRTMKRALEGQ